MKKQLLLVVAIFFATLQSSFAQQFFEMINAGTYSVQEIQKVAEAYFGIHGKEKGSGYKQHKMWEYHALKEADENGKLISATEKEMRIQKFRASLPKTQVLATTANWTEIGPTKRNPTSSWNPGVDRVECISVDPNNYNHILVGAPNGGAWNTTNGGTTWSTVYSGQHYDIEFKLGVPNTVYACDGGKVRYSNDGGANWTSLQVSLAALAVWP
ncbi:MAG: hypothetical protein ACO3EE_05700 [Flavobacteriales bacterium]